MGNPMAGNWSVMRSGGSAEVPVAEFVAVVAPGGFPSPLSFAASSREKPLARDEASRGRFATLFMKPSVLEVSVPDPESDSDCEPESVSESESYGMYLE